MSGSEPRTSGPAPGESKIPKDGPLGAATDKSPIALFDNVSKSFSGGARRRVALSQVSFEVSPGSVVGLIGANGAGKTTSLRILATVIRPDSGRVEIFGKGAVHAGLEIRQRLGYMPEEAGLYPQLTAVQQLTYQGLISGLPREVCEKRAKELVRLFEMEPFAGLRIGTYSYGMGKRVSMAQAIIHEPSLLLLDEPFAGLDPATRSSLRSFLDQYHRSGGTIVLSTQDMDELERVCTRAILFHGGRVMLSASVEDLVARRLASGEMTYWLSLDGKAEQVQAEVRRLDGVLAVEARADKTLRVQLEPTQLSIGGLIEAIQRMGVRVTHVKEEASHLERMMRELGGDSPDAG